MKAGRKVRCEHCTKVVGLTKSTTTMGSPFVRRHSIGKRGSPECAGSGVPAGKEPTQGRES